MNHAGDGLLQSYIDGEVIGEAKASLMAHLDACTECGQELEELRAASATFGTAMSLMSGAVALEPARSQVLRAHKTAADTGLPLTARASARPGRFAGMAAGSLARAAALVLLLAGGAAAMIPGSPIRRWLGSGLERIAGAFSDRDESVATPAAPVAVPREMVPAGDMEVAAVNGQVRVQIWASAGDGQLKVRLVDGNRAKVQTDTSAHAVRFRSAAGRIEILNLGASDAEVQIPRSLRLADIEVNGTQFFFKDGATLRVTGPVVRRTDDEIVFRTGS